MEKYSISEFNKCVSALRLEYSDNILKINNEEVFVAVESISVERPELPQRRMPFDNDFFEQQMSETRCFALGFCKENNFLISIENLQQNVDRIDFVRLIKDAQDYFEDNNQLSFKRYDGSQYEATKGKVASIACIKYKDNHGNIDARALGSYLTYFDNRPYRSANLSNINETMDKNTFYQQIYYGAPGTGKSHEVKKLTGELDDASNEYDKTNVFRTTFHPDTDYAAFVGCYKPTMKPVVEQYRAVAGKEEDIVYEFVPQTFTDAYVYAYNHADESTYLVIEEINRGNCAQIFGDLFQLLDRKADGTSEYTIKADKDLANYLTAQLGEDSEGIKDGKLRLPANLNILSTMNTSDQSLFPMDSAFKRRWDWKYVAISYNEPKSSAFMINVGEGFKWVDFIEQVNERIFSLTQSEDKQLGNFFIKDSIDADQFKSKVMFYLWYEVLRDEVENSKYFFYYTTTDETGKENNHKFTFKDLYGDNANDILEGFLKYITKKAE